MKKIQFLDTSLRDGFQSVFGARALTDDFIPAVQAGVHAGIENMEAGGGARFQALFMYCGESAFDMDSLRLASASIQVYTPHGEVRTLPEGCSALDFAFNIHEQLGLHATRVRINGKIRQLKARLMDGDQIDVETAERPTVLPKWLEWAVTPRARNSIRRYLRSKVKPPRNVGKS